MKETNKYVFFWNGIYSQWYPSEFTIDGIKYSSCEQYMMHQKALLFGDTEIAKEIMEALTPAIQKQLGKQVRGFDRVLWDRSCLQIVYEGNLAKFTQNEDLKNQLLNTADRLFVETSPVDYVWGVGMSEGDEGVEDPINWRGLNLLGWGITLVKQQLKSEKSN